MAALVKATKGDKGSPVPWADPKVAPWFDPAWASGETAVPAKLRSLDDAHAAQLQRQRDHEEMAREKPAAAKKKPLPPPSSQQPKNKGGRDTSRQGFPLIRRRITADNGG